MSSIRPLATITLLAVAGFVLYFKITETEPVIPDGVGDFEFSAQLDSGLDAPAAWATSAGDASTAAPGFAAAGGEAPAYAPAATTGEAPAWGDDATVTTAAAPPFDAAAEATTTQPEMPALPGEDATAAAPTPAFSGAVEVDASVAADVPGAAPPLAAVPEFSMDDTTAAVTPPVAETTPVADVLPPETPAVGRYGQYAAGGSVAEMTSTPTSNVLPTTDPVASPPPASVYSQSKLAIQSALDRGELSQALQMLSDWYGDPSLTSGERSEVDALLGQLAGSVIYSTEHRLAAPYMVQAGDTLDSVAAKYQIPPQLLGKINGVAAGQPLAPGRKLKVVQGPFSALIDVSDRQLTLMLDRRYAGKFPLQIDTSLTVEDGQWEVVDKPIAPASATAYQPTPGDGVDRAVMLQNPTAASGQVAVLRGPGAVDPVSPEPAGRVIRLDSGGIQDVFDILSVGSRVTVRR